MEKVEDAARTTAEIGKDYTNKLFDIEGNLNTFLLKNDKRLLSAYISIVKEQIDPVRKHTYHC